MKIDLRKNYSFAKADPQYPIYECQFDLSADDAPPSTNAVYHYITKQYMEEFYKAILELNIREDIHSLSYIGYTEDEIKQIKEQQAKEKAKRDNDELYSRHCSAAFINAHKYVDDFSKELFTIITRQEAVEKCANIITSGLLLEIEKYLNTNPMFRNTFRKYPYLKKLTPDCIAQIIISIDIIGRFNISGNSYLLGMYQEAGDDRGIYKLMETEDDMIPLYKLMYRFDPGLTKAERNDVIHKLMVYAPELKVNNDPNLIAVGNGIWDFEAKDFLRYDEPECKKLVFTKKIRTNFINSIYQQILSNDPEPLGSVIYENGEVVWDVNSWMKEFFELTPAEKKLRSKTRTSDDNFEKEDAEREEMTDFLWKIIHAFCRPNVEYNRAIWFGNPGGNGNNGKGTFTALLRNLIGPSSCKSINLREFSEKFALTGITNWIGIIADENSFQGVVEDVSRYKCLVTHDPVAVNVKFGKTYDYIFNGMTLQCFNEYPNIGDKSGSFARRLLLVNWEKSFTGHERPEIKDDYIKRHEVLEYILCKILTDERYIFTQFKESELPELVKRANSKFVLDTVAYKLFIKEFCLPDPNDADRNCRPLLRWKRIPINFLYDLYSGWHMENYKRKPTETLTDFKNKLKCDSELINFWDVETNRTVMKEKDYIDPSKQKDSKNKKDCNIYIAEPLIITYGKYMDKWKNKLSSNKNPDYVCVPMHMFGERFYGFITYRDEE